MAALWVAMCVAACSAVRHVPDGEYLLEKVKIEVVDSADVSTKKLHNYLRQSPNHKVLGVAKLQLGIYNLSGRDSIPSGFSKWLRKIGESPVIYDSLLADVSARQIRLALVNQGYNDAQVTYLASSRKHKRKTLEFFLRPGKPFVVESIDYEIPDSAIARYVYADTATLPMQPGSLLNLNELDVQRAIITERLRNNGYYSFTKECINFLADTVAGSKNVALTMRVLPPVARHVQGVDSVGMPDQYAVWRFGKITIIPDFQPGENVALQQFADRDTIVRDGVTILYGRDRYLSPSAIIEHLHILPGQKFSTSAIDRTYESLNRLSILRYVNLITTEVVRGDSVHALDVTVLLSPTKKMGVSVEIEGTNSEGDFGVGGGVTFQHRNLAHGGELLSFKLRGSYESLSGDLEDLINDSYTEVAAEVAITFPKFQAPFLRRSFKQRMRATTEFALTFMRQERPEYTRIIAGGAWRYKWADRANRTRRTFDLLDINVVNLPKSTYDFIDNIAPDNPLLRYSYEDHFIMRMAYTWQHTNRRSAGSQAQQAPFQANTYTVRASGETAGALLYAIYNLAGVRREDGAYKIFGIQYAQYLKGEIDYTINHRFTDRNSLAFHAGFGIAFPYGNSTMVPFEKRFYAGGANSVRGWNVRTLGPGSYDSRNSVDGFINQCGDISLLLNLEYRNKLFWVLEGALFIDAGNIWTIRNYPTQRGGLFEFRNFWKEIAASYGVGLRMDFNYFLLRLDMGVKAVNPSVGQDRWPITHPSWRRDVAFHFSVGYPF